MWRLALRGIIQRRGRLVSTMLAIVLGVGFVAGVFVLTDTIRQTFDDLFGSVYAKAETVIEPKSELGGRLNNAPRRLPADLVTKIAAIDGVDVAQPYVREFAQAVDIQGEPIGGDNAPAFGISWTTDSRLNPWIIAQGRAPSAPRELVVDRTTARQGKLDIGQTVKVLSRNPTEDFTLVGIMRFGTADSAAAASVLAFEPADANRLFATNGTADQILVIGKPGIGETELTRRIAQVAATDQIDVLTGSRAAELRQNDLRQRINGFTTFLLVFALVALFVGSFIILNTFSILVAQRRQELALLRAVGASRAQIRSSILAEAIIIGILASVIGIGVGIGLAQLLKAVFGLFGFSLPTGAVVLKPRTIVVSLILGTLITVVAALAPAWRAAGIPPVAALRESSIEPQHTSRLRVLVGILMVTVSFALAVDGLRRSGNPAVIRVGIAGAVLLIAGAVLGPVLITLMAKALRRPLGWRGVNGTLATQNVIRSPRRASFTGLALVLGLALVAALLVFASSFKGLLERTVEGQFKGDFIVVGQGFSGFSPEVAKAVAATDGVEASASFRFGVLQLEGPDGTNKSTEFIAAVDTKNFARVLDIPMIQGAIRDVGLGQVAIGNDEAAEKSLRVGDPYPVRFQLSGQQVLTITALLDAKNAQGITQGATRIISLETYDANISPPLDVAVYAKGVEGRNSVAIKRAITESLKNYPNTKVLDQAAYKAFVNRQLNGFLGFVFVLLFLSIVIAAVGVANTLKLSVAERTRELGLLRGIGMSRRQTRSMIRLESVVMSAFGAGLGLAIGVSFGVALVRSLRSQGFTVIVVPWAQLAVALAIAVAIGLLAAIGAARRAARLDILAAISTQ